MDDLRQRKPQEDTQNYCNRQTSSGDEDGPRKPSIVTDVLDSDDERLPEERLVENLAKELPQATDKTAELIDQALSSLPAKWRNYVIRTVFTLLMVSFFVLLIYLGPLALMIATLFVQVKCFQEIIAVGYAVYRVHGLPWFRSLSWYFLITSNYFFYGESLVDYFGILLHRVNFMRPLITYHRFISFCLFCLGFVWFVLSLVKKYYIRQFSLFAWTHVTLLIVVTQSYLIIQNLFEGLIWFIVPVSMIVINDVCAYLFGFFFGRTPLIKLSPKKTWEGFIGGGFATVILGAFLSQFICRFNYMVCPIEYSEEEGGTTFDCVRSPIFQLTEYHVPLGLNVFFKIFRLPETVTVYPFVWHSIALSLFSSIIGPFGGFFASGFKRAFKIKDFGDVIPGHGGIMDRFDCQFLMATFVNVYISSFIAAPSVQKLLSQIFVLKLEDQLNVYESLRERLLAEHILLPTPEPDLTPLITS